MKPTLAPTVKTQARILRDALERIAAHFAAAAEDLRILEEVHGIGGIDLPSLRVDEQPSDSSTPMSTTRTKRDFLELAEVGELLNLDTRSLRRLRRDPNSVFPAAFSFGTALRFKRAEIESWIERQRSIP